MALAKVVLFCVLAVVIVALTAKVMSSASKSLDPNDDAVARISERCAAQPLSFLPASSPAWLRYVFASLPPGAASYYCLLVGFFETLAVARPTNAGLSWFFLPFASLHFMLMLKESVLADSFLLAPLWPAFVGAMGQVSGISVWFPLAWLPYYFFKSAGRSPGAPVASFRFRLGALLTYVLLFNIAGITALRPGTDVLTYFVVFFQIAPVLPCLFVAFVPRGASASPAFVRLTYAFFGGIGAMGHIVGALTVVNSPGSLAAIWSLLTAGQGVGDQTIDLMIWIDFISFLASTWLLVVWDHGLLTSIVFLVLSPVLSPALLLAWLLIKNEQPVPPAVKKPANNKQFKKD